MPPYYYEACVPGYGLPAIFFFSFFASLGTVCAMYFTDVYPRDLRIKGLQDNLEILEQEIASQQVDSEYEHSRRRSAEQELQMTGSEVETLRGELEQVQINLRAAQERIREYHSGMRTIVALVIIYLAYYFYRPVTPIEYSDRTEL